MIIRNGCHSKIMIEGILRMIACKHTTTMRGFFNGVHNSESNRIFLVSLTHVIRIAWLFEEIQPSIDNPKFLPILSVSYYQFLEFHHQWNNSIRPVVKNGYNYRCLQSEGRIVSNVLRNSSTNLMYNSQNSKDSPRDG